VQLVILIIILVLAAATYYLMYIRPKLDPAYRAGEFEKQNLMREAAVEYKKLLEERPSDFLSHYRLGNIYIRLNEIDQALPHFEEIIRINRYNHEVDKVDVLKAMAKLY